MKTIVLGLVAALMFAAPALAGQQYVDKTGFAISGYDVIAIWEQKQNPIGKRQPKATPGKASITAEYNGAKWAFSSAANRDKFKADPAKFAPQFDGHCAYGVALGGKVPANPHLWRIIEGKLYMNITKTVVELWQADIPKHLKNATKNWTKLAAKPAAKRKVPELDIAKAPL